MPNFENPSAPIPSPEESHHESIEKRKELLESIAKRGRYVLYGYIMDIPHKIISANRGWNSIGSKDFNSIRINNESPILLKAFERAGTALKSMDVGAAMYMEPIIRRENKYVEKRREVEIPAKNWFSKPTKEIKIENELVGEVETRQKIKAFNGDRDDESDATRLGFWLSSTENIGWPVIANRPGGYMIVSLILPESLAEMAYDEIKSDPRFMAQILEKMEPGLLEEMHIPERILNFEKIMVVPKHLKPENMVDSEMVPSQGMKVKGLKPEYNTPEFVRDVGK